MSFKHDSEKVKTSVETLKGLLKECEELYNKELPKSDVDNGLTHDELLILCKNVRETCFYIGEIINNSITFLGYTSEMFYEEDKKTAEAISQYV